MRTTSHPTFLPMRLNMRCVVGMPLFTLHHCLTLVPLLHNRAHARHRRRRGTVSYIWPEDTRSLMDIFSVDDGVMLEMSREYVSLQGPAAKISTTNKIVWTSTVRVDVNHREEEWWLMGRNVRF